MSAFKQTTCGKGLGMLQRFVVRFFVCRRAAIAPLTALMLLPIVGGIAYAVELGSWNYMQRSMQNAADSAALAAATVNSTTGTTSANEARAAAARFNYVNGVNSTTVNSAITGCPAPASGTCHEAVITTLMPITFSGIFGFTGNQQIVARAVAVAAGGAGGAPLTNNVCVWTFTNLQTNGTPDANLAGCSVLSNLNMTCTGGGLHADFAVAGGTVSGACAQVPSTNNLSSQTNLPADSYKSLGTSANIPSACGSTTPPQLEKSKGQWVVPTASKATNEISDVSPGTPPTWTGTQKTFCGDVQLTGDVTLTGTTTIIIENGRLDLNSHTIKTETGAAATIIFSGDPTSTAYSHYPTSLNGGGIIDIAAPPSSSTSPWAGIAIYQDPRMTTSTVDFTYTGNNPAWKVTGVVYLPNATTTFSGVVNKASNGAACIILVGDAVTINGTGKIIGDVTGCEDAGIDPPIVTVTPAFLRPKLVL